MKEYKIIKPKQKTMISQLKIGTLFTVKGRKGHFVKVEHPSKYYRDDCIDYVDTEVKEIIENY